MSDVVKTIKLSEPVRVGDKVITELNFRKAVAGDFWNVPMNPKLGDLLEAGAKMCGLMANEMKQISPRDMAEVASFLGDAMGVSAPTGEKLLVS